MKALVTGAGGLVGSYLCEALVEKGYKRKGSFLCVPQTKSNLAAICSEEMGFNS